MKEHGPQGWITNIIVYLLISFAFDVLVVGLSHNKHRPLPKSWINDPLDSLVLKNIQCLSAKFDKSR